MPLQLPSPVSSLCPHFGVCGGCSHQDVPYDEQLRRKEKFVRDCLEGFSVGEMCPILPSPEIIYYRNKMEFSFGDIRDSQILRGESPQLPPDETNPIHLGLHPKGRFSVVTPTPDCRLLSPEAQIICGTISSWATVEKIPIYLRHKNQGVLRHVVIREGKNTNQRMVNVVSTSGLAQIDSLGVALKNSGCDITTVLWTIHDGLSDVARGPRTVLVWGEGFIQERVGDILFQVAPFSFMQTNTHASEKMIQILKSWARADTAHSILFDLYCGAGTIGLNLAGAFKRVIGIESEPSAVASAREAARLNTISNAEFFEGRAENLTAILRRESAGTSSTVVVDPPRVGLHDKVVQALLSSEPAAIYYVSCNPESLARDLRGLGAKYTIETVQPMDFFPHTDHVETVVRLKKDKSQ